MDQRRPEFVVRALQQFSALVAREQRPADIDELALAISAVLQPGLDVQPSMRALDDLAAGCEERSRDAVARHLFGSGRFSGDTVTYRSWRNSCLDQVIARGRGIPISLAIVTIEVARRAGVRLVGVGMPGHFLVGDPTDAGWFLDAFDSGRVLDPPGCQALYERVTAGASPWHDSFLQPTPNLSIVARMLNNLTAVFSHGDPVRMGLVTRMRLALPPFVASPADPRPTLAVFN